MNLEAIFKPFKATYLKAATQNGVTSEEAAKNVSTLYELAQKECTDPTLFEIYHTAVREPFDYYTFGMNFFGALMVKKDSTVLGYDKLEKIVKQLAQGENVILLANHQTEPDPQIISTLLNQKYPELVEKMIFVAGHRVITDPVAIPFSLGRNLLCIYSKRHVENPPEKKEEKISHNRKALDKLKQLLQEGGKCIYVAPSGGRDRKSPEGEVKLAPFDPGSVELFRLVAKDTPTHFYPFAMATYNLFPPPDTVQSELGESRIAQSSPVHIAFGEELNLDSFPGMPDDKHERRVARAEYVFNHVQELYKKISGDL